jgi:hypothetical protein
MSSLWNELPTLLIETGVPSQSLGLSGVTAFSLTTGRVNLADPTGQVQLLTPADLSIPRGWAVNALADATGIEHYLNQGGGAITPTTPVINSAVPGSTLVWIEYRSGEDEPSNGSVRSVSVTTGRISIGCQFQNCTIANILLVPPLPSSKRVARLAYGYSPMLRAPNDHRGPVKLSSDWASIYAPPPQGYPSPQYDPSTILRLVAILFGHIFALAGLLAPTVRRWPGQFLLEGARKRSAVIDFGPDRNT